MEALDIKILLVDDDEDIIELLQYNLKKEGYTIYTATNGKQGIDLAKKEKPHLVLLDIMMPDVDGIETCRQLREIEGLNNLIIAFLTARNEDYSQIAGFDAGADDYISKPIKPRVLISRIQALLRRLTPSTTDSKADDGIVKAGPFEINRGRYIIKKDNQEFAIPRKEFELFSLLASKPGKVFTREDILTLVWGDDVVVGDRTIDVHIRKLREKFGDDYFKTIKGVGYKFES